MIYLYNRRISKNESILAPVGWISLLHGRTYVREGALFTVETVETLLKQNPQKKSIQSVHLSHLHCVKKASLVYFLFPIGL